MKLKQTENESRRAGIGFEEGELSKEWKGIFWDGLWRGEGHEGETGTETGPFVDIWCYMCDFNNTRIKLTLISEQVYEEMTTLLLWSSILLSFFLLIIMIICMFGLMVVTIWIWWSADVIKSGRDYADWKKKKKKEEKGVCCVVEWQSKVFVFIFTVPKILIYFAPSVTTFLRHLQFPCPHLCSSCFLSFLFFS